MGAYHPPQRAIRAAVLTSARWIHATFHLPRLHAFDDHLARGRTFLPLTQVGFDLGEPVAFLALRRSAAVVVAPECRPQMLLLASPADVQPRHVTCHLERVSVRGSLDLRPAVRTSDFLAHQDGFIALRDCTLVPPIPGRDERLPVVFVNARAIVAVAEERPPAAAAHEPVVAAAPPPVPSPAGTLAAGAAPPGRSAPADGTQRLPPAASPAPTAPPPARTLVHVLAPPPAPPVLARIAPRAGAARGRAP